MRFQNYSFVSQKAKVSNNAQIGAFCIIEDGVEIGPNVIIGSHSIIGKNTKISDNVEVGSHCLIGNDVLLSNDCYVGPYCEIKDQVKVSDKCNLQGNIRVGNNTFLGEETVVKYGAILTSNAFVSKNCFIGPNCILVGSDVSRAAEEAGGEMCTIIGERVFLGAGTVVNASCRIVNDVYVGANSYVKTDIFNKGVFVGTPVEKIRDELPKYSLKVIDGVGVV